MESTSTANELLKTAPPLTVTGLTLFGYTLPDVVGVLTLIYLGIQIVLALPK